MLFWDISPKSQRTVSSLSESKTKLFTLNLPVIQSPKISRCLSLTRLCETSLNNPRSDNIVMTSSTEELCQNSEMTNTHTVELDLDPFIQKQQHQPPLSPLCQCRSCPGSPRILEAASWRAGRRWTPPSCWEALSSSPDGTGYSCSPGPQVEYQNICWTCNLKPHVVIFKTREQLYLLNMKKHEGKKWIIYNGGWTSELVQFMSEVFQKLRNRSFKFQKAAGIPTVNRVIV